MKLLLLVLVLVEQLLHLAEQINTKKMEEARKSVYWKEASGG